MASNLRAMASNLTGMASTFPLFRKILAPQLVAGVTRNTSYDLEQDHINVLPTNECGLEGLEEVFGCLKPTGGNAAANAMRPEGCHFRRGPSVARGQQRRLDFVHPQQEESEPFDSVYKLKCVGFLAPKPAPELIFIGRLNTPNIGMQNKVKVDV